MKRLLQVLRRDKARANLEFEQSARTIDTADGTPPHYGIGPEAENFPPTSPVFPDGVKILHDCKDAVVDVCFIHGLTGNREGTWTTYGQSNPWPETLLPPQLSQARILTYGYDAYILRQRAVSKNGLGDHAKNFLNDLTTDRYSANASSRPIIFVAHSLGGLVCKEAILLSRDNPESHLRGIFEYTKGIVFMGTPHRGSWIAKWAKIPVTGLGVVYSTNKTILKVLKTDDAHLQSVQDRFWSMIREQQRIGRDLEVTCFFEELPLGVVGMVVPKDSAILEGYNAISIHANHRDMVKFTSIDDNGFKRVLGELIRFKSQIQDSLISQLIPPREGYLKKRESSEVPNPGRGGQITMIRGSRNISSGSGSHFPGAIFTGPFQLNS